MKKERLEVVDSNDEVIGTEDRTVIHEKGLLHREVHVWFVTPRGEVIFQHRAKDKDTYPDLLDATVGGHVEIGANYEETAIKEAEEETGVRISASELIPLAKIRTAAEDRKTNTINDSFKMEYAYLYKGDMVALRVEEGKALGFEAWPLTALVSLAEPDKEKFVPVLDSPDFRPLFDKMRALI